MMGGKSQFLPLFQFVGVALYLCASAWPAAASSDEEAALARLRSPPLGLPVLTVPPDNPVTPEKIFLGRKLFFDRRLSHNNTMSCGMCHIPEQGFTNNELMTPVGMNGRSLRRNAPTVLNAAYEKSLFHDGRETALETQIILPLIAPNEMGNPSVGVVIEKIASLRDYDGLFEAAFGGGPTIDRIGMAIASWERTLLAGNSAFDRWYYGKQPDAMTSQQVQGFEIFTGKGNCSSCHVIGEEWALFTDNDFHDTGLSLLSANGGLRPGSKVKVEIAPGIYTTLDADVVASVSGPREADSGRLEVTDKPEDLHRFKTPNLRNVALTGPYMHDGSLLTLRSVVEFYNRGGVPHDGLDPLILPLGLRDVEMDALVAFLESLTSGNIDALIKDARRAAVGN